MRHASVDLGGKAFESLTHLHRVRRRRRKPAQRLGQALEVARRPRSNLIERGRRPNTLAAWHYKLDQGIAGLLVMLDGEDVASHAAVGTHAPPHLLAARPGGFAGGALAPRQAGIFLELVDAIEPGRVGGGGETAADAEAVDRRARSDEGRNQA